MPERFEGRTAWNSVCRSGSASTCWNVKAQHCFCLWLWISSTIFLFSRMKCANIKTNVQHYSSQIFEMPNLSRRDITCRWWNARGIHHKSSISLLLIKAAEWAQVFSLFYSYVLMISRKTDKGVCIGLKRCPAGEKNVPPEELTQANAHKLMLKWELLNLTQLL